MFIIIPTLKKFFEYQRESKKINFVLELDLLSMILKTITIFYIADTFGELGLFFAIKIKHYLVHFQKVDCLIEASHFKSAVIFGPNMKNFKKIKDKIFKQNLVFKEILSNLQNIRFIKQQKSI